MSSLEELRGRISTVNATVAKLNEQRSRNMGMRETLLSQREAAVKQYLTAYGVDLSKVSIEEEFNKVMTEKNAELTQLEGAINAINAGDYDTANKILGGESVEPAVEVQKAPTQEVTAPAPSTVTSEPIVSGQVETYAQPTPPQVAQFGAVSSAPQGEVAPPPTFNFQPTMSEPPKMQTPPTPPAGMGITPAQAEPAEPAVAPPPTMHVGVVGSGLNLSGLDLSGLSTPLEPVNRATDFSSILGGQPFQP